MTQNCDYKANGNYSLIVEKTNIKIRTLWELWKQNDLEVTNLRKEMVESQQDMKKFCWGSGKIVGRKALQNEN